MRILALTFSVLLVIVGAGLNPVSAKILRAQVASQVQKKCPRCNLEIGRIRVSWFHSLVIAEDVKFTDDPSADVAFDFSSPRVELHFKEFSFLREAPVVTQLKLTRPHVTVREKSDSPPSPRPDYPPPGYAFAGLPPLRVGEVLIDDANFTYEQLIHGKVGALNFHHIELSAGSFVTRDRLLTVGYRRPLEIRTTAIVEKSGRFKLDISFDPFAEKNTDWVLIELTGLDLAEISPLLSATDGISLTGILDQALAKMDLHQGHLSGQLGVTYQNVHFKYEATPERGKIASAVTQFFQALEVKKTRSKGETGRLPEAPISEQRQAREPITKFILRGLKDAVRKIMTS